MLAIDGWWGIAIRLFAQIVQPYFKTMKISVYVCPYSLGFLGTAVDPPEHIEDKSHFKCAHAHTHTHTQPHTHTHTVQYCKTIDIITTHIYTTHTHTHTHSHTHTDTHTHTQ